MLSEYEKFVEDKLGDKVYYYYRNMTFLLLLNAIIWTGVLIKWTIKYGIFFHKLL